MPDPDRPDTETAAALTGDPGPGERTAVVRPDPGIEIDAAVRQLEECGARVQSAGRGAIVVAADAAGLERIGHLPWVRAVESPRPLSAKRFGL